jgi:murein L,D-transpeptidase YcbB/YkuD
VAHKGSGASGGNTLILKHASDLFTVYYHLQKPSHLKVGDRVELGQVVALSGNTGKSTGPHLHWEVRKSQRWGNTVDPVPYLQGAPSVVAAPLKVTGRLDRQTWKAWQEALKTKGFYKGVPDGRPGVMTTRAIQEWAGVKADGIIGPDTRRAVQEKLGVKADGVWGKITVSELQRQLNMGAV